MGIDMLDIGFRVEKKFGLKKFRPLPPVSPPLWTAGGLFEQMWRGLQGEEPAWEFSLIWEPAKQAWELRRKADDYLRSFHQGWRMFMPHQMDRLIPMAGRAEVWKYLSALFEVDVTPLDLASTGDEVPFPPHCQTTRQLLDHFERAWWDGRVPRQDQWRPSAHPPPADAQKWTRETAWLAFAEMLCACLGLDDDKVTLEATLIGDLGMS